VNIHIKDGFKLLTKIIKRRKAKDKTGIYADLDCDEIMIGDQMFYHPSIMEIKSIIKKG
jgi:UDP-N-acetylglucosamine pyrophosphorylase